MRKEIKIKNSDSVVQWANDEDNITNNSRNTQYNGTGDNVSGWSSAQYNCKGRNVASGGSNAQCNIVGNNLAGCSWDLVGCSWNAQCNGSGDNVSKGERNAQCNGSGDNVSKGDWNAQCNMGANNVSKGDYNAQLSLRGTCEGGDFTVAMSGKGLKLGKNSVGVLLGYDNNVIKEIIINAPEGSIPVRWDTGVAGSFAEKEGADIITLNGKQYKLIN